MVLRHLVCETFSLMLFRLSILPFLEAEFQLQELEEIIFTAREDSAPDSDLISPIKVIVYDCCSKIVRHF